MNYLYVSRFYFSINDFKKVIFFLRKLSINFYFTELTKYRAYFYSVVNHISINYLKIQKIFNSIVSNKYYNPYKLDIISQNSNILKDCGLNFNYSLRNYQNIK